MLHAEAQLPVGEDDEGEGLVIPAAGERSERSPKSGTQEGSRGALRDLWGFPGGETFLESGLVWDLEEGGASNWWLWMGAEAGPRCEELGIVRERTWEGARLSGCWEVRARSQGLREQDDWWASRKFSEGL